MSQNKICVDASFVVRLLTVDAEDSPYQKQWDKWVESSCQIIAPSLLFYEVTNALYRSARAEYFSKEVAQELLEVGLDLGILLLGNDDLHKQAFEVAQRYSLTATYDAHYLALAEKSDADLWTADRRLFNIVSEFINWINLLV